MIKYLRLLLLPFSLLYGLIILIRNKLYDAGVLKSVRFELPVICVGNLVVGGSGKSPVTEYLVSLFPDKRIAILSRGYGRKTKGFILADESSTAGTIGDEPLQFYNKFPDVTVAVCEDRVTGINQLKGHHDLIILDDAFQHRKVQAGFSILLFEYQKLLSPRFLLPAGNLRESFSGCKRAQALLVTKAPADISAEQRLACKRKFANDEGQMLSFSFLNYQDLVPLFTKSDPLAVTPDTSVFLLTGIANPKPLLSYLREFTASIHHHDYPDHYQFSHQNIRKLIKDYQEDLSVKKIILTTEKDAQRLLDDALKELLLNLPVYYLPIRVEIQAEDKATFDQKILDYVSSTTRNR
ncbi:tetraacyldisaccharide 4'-kinase [Pedobacter frigoris]|uniref:tetraacyldisaccharide 4'-kinase n=1 Tax=Pedobacter frigoris TaxID=2571272 RepID=UPI002930F6D0|nr:tetraacyldisaccharide 4'-kinase [Pedobacter frigoris]